MSGYFNNESHFINFIGKIARDNATLINEDNILPADFYVKYLWGSELIESFRKEVSKNPQLLEEDQIVEWLQTGRVQGYVPERIRHVFTEEFNECLNDLRGMPGVYTFWTKSKKPLYVGTSKSLSERIVTSFSERFTTFDKPVFARYAITKTASDATVVEMYYIAKLKPALNGTAKYQDELTLTLNAPALCAPIQVNKVGRRMQRNGVFYISEAAA